MQPITERQLKLFLIKLFFNHNLANGLVCRTDWRDEIAKAIIDLYDRNELGYDFWNRLKRWALIEYLNTGSYMRAECPIRLKGSGRWLARDCGGRYGLLKSIMIQAIFEEDKYDAYRVLKLDNDWIAICILYNLPRNLWIEAPVGLAKLYLQQEETNGRSYYELQKNN